MRSIVLLVIALASWLPAQTNSSGVQDVGLTMQDGNAASTNAGLVGQRCGPFTCTPFAQPSLSNTVSTTRTVRIYGAPGSLYVLAISTGPVAQPCVPIPGIGNALILTSPVAVLSFGVTGPQLPSTSIACNQGVATYQLVLPVVAPAVISFRLQALADSFTTQAPAFTVAVQGLAF